MLTLTTKELTKIYKKRKVVNRVSIQVQQGEIVGLLGPNGAGKTTTFYMITGMIKPNEGKIFFDDLPRVDDMKLLDEVKSDTKKASHRNLTNLPMYKRARLGIGYLAQEPSIFRKLTVEQNIMAILETLRISKKDREKRLQELLTELKITHLAKNKAHSLSGGERRRVEITRALVTNPKFILLDEPFAGIDPIAVEDIQNIIQNLKKKGIGILITDHNVHETLAITDRAYLLFDGAVLKSGTTHALANDPEALKLYLGEKFKLDR